MFVFAVIVCAVLAVLFSVGVRVVLLEVGVAAAQADRITIWLALGGTVALLLYVGWRILEAAEALRVGAGVDVAHGSARFMNDAGTERLTDGDGLIVGRDIASDKLLRFAGEAHLMTIAPTRSGKGVGTIIPNLLTYPGPVVCIDPKGENASVAAARRREFGPVHVLDPFGVSGIASASYNPLEAIGPEDPDGAEDAAALADALVHDPPGQVHEAHWNEEAKALIAGLLLHIASGPRDRLTLARLRHLLTLPPAFFTALLDDMAASDAAGGLVARAANRHRGKADREAAGVLSSAQRHTHFLDSARVAGVMEDSTFDLSRLASDNATLFIVLPPDRLAHHSRWLRLMVVTALTRGGAARRDSAAKPVLLLLDEFAALGRLEPVARAMGLMAGYGLQLWPILQDIHQLRSLYGPDAGSFLSNAGCVQLFNASDIDTAEWISRSLGDTTVNDLARGAIDDDGGAMFEGPGGEHHGYGYGEHLYKRSLLTPDEVRRMPGDEAILLLQGRPPVQARKVRYYADAEFEGLYNPGA